jgi:hypothetical protein
LSSVLRAAEIAVAEGVPRLSLALIDAYIAEPELLGLFQPRPG